MSTLSVNTITPQTGTTTTINANTVVASGKTFTAPGSVIQIVGNTNSTYNGGASGGLTRDDTIPQQSEVHMCVEVNITPRFANSKLFIQAAIPGGHQNNTYSACCLFKDSGEAIQVMPHYFPSNGTEATWNLTHFMDAGSTSTATFKVGLGSNSGNIYQNGNNSARKYGGASASTIVIMEIAQ